MVVIFVASEFFVFEVAPIISFIMIMPHGREFYLSFILIVIMPPTCEGGLHEVRY